METKKDQLKNELTEKINFFLPCSKKYSRYFTNKCNLVRNVPILFPKIYQAF